MSRPTLAEVQALPEPILNDNFDLHRIDCHSDIARVIAPHLRELAMSVKSIIWTERPVPPEIAGITHLVPLRPHVLDIVLYDMDVSQGVLDARAALTKHLDAIVLCQYNMDGEPTRYVVFEDVMAETVKTQLHGAEGKVTEKEIKLLAVSMTFKTVKELKEYPA